MKKHVNVLSIVLLLLLGISTGSYAQQLSDQEVRTNVQSITQPLQKIAALEPQVFEYNTTRFSHLALPKGQQYGFLTENMERVMPGAVHTTRYSYMKGKNSYQSALVKSTDMQTLIPLLVASIKEQQMQIDALKAEVEKLKSAVGK